MKLLLKRSAFSGQLITLAAISFVTLSSWQLGRLCAAEETIVTVGGSPITEADLQLEALLRRVPAEQIEQHRHKLIEELIDLRLIATFLAGRRVSADSAELEQQVERIHRLIRQSEEEPEAFFHRIGLTEEQLRNRLALGLAWQTYVQQITTGDHMRRFFDEHRRELDGTQLRARHIILKAAQDDPQKRQSDIQKLAALRRQIQSGSLTFADAAMQHSAGPSRNEGGDVGYFAHRGIMSADFADAAFSLKVGELSEPVETAFGVHLIEVTEERPGQLSLEDVRGQVLEQISRERWSEQVAKDRNRVPIRRADTDQ